MSLSDRLSKRSTQSQESKRRQWQSGSEVYGRMGGEAAYGAKSCRDCTRLVAPCAVHLRLFKAAQDLHENRRRVALRHLTCTASNALRCKCRDGGLSLLKRVFAPCLAIIEAS